MKTYAKPKIEVLKELYNNKLLGCDEKELWSVFATLERSKASLVLTYNDYFGEPASFYTVKVKGYRNKDDFGRNVFSIAYYHPRTDKTYFMEAKCFYRMTMIL